MQIPPSSAASQAAGIAAQSAAHDRSSANPATAAAGPPTANVEQSGESNPDRDAQGQGDGQPTPQPPIVDEVELESQASALVDEAQAAPRLPDEPPSQLDIVG